MRAPQSVRESIFMWAMPDDVWSVLREVSALDTWMPWVTSCGMDDDVRITVNDGIDVPIMERIVNIDDEHRAYSYEYVSGPLDFKTYLARVQVLPFGPSQSEVTWVGSFTAADRDLEKLENIVSGTYRRALRSLRTHCVTEPEGTLLVPPTLS